VDDEALKRYSRHILLPQFGFEGQERLNQAKVLIIGVGGLGSPAALYLGASGVEKITLVDDDTVEISNLPRQIVHNQDTLGLNKTQSAKLAISRINDTIKINPITRRLTGDKLLKECHGHDIILDCTDRFTSRFAINQAAIESKTPLVSAAAVGFDGQISSFIPQDKSSPCYQCLYADGFPEDTLCSENGILSPVVGTMGLLQALEAIKIITAVGDTLLGKLLIFDGLTTSFRTLKLKKDPACAACAT